MTAKTPWHLWLVGSIALLWNAFGAYDYVMTQTQNTVYMSAFTTTQLDYFYSIPSWSVGVWAIAIWSAVLASILLLMRKKLATPAYLVSLIFMATNAIYSYGLSGGYAVMGSSGLIFTGIIFLICLFLYLYSRSMASRGVLN